VHSEPTHDHSRSYVSGTNAHVTVANPYALRQLTYIFMSAPANLMALHARFAQTTANGRGTPDTATGRRRWHRRSHWLVCPWCYHGSLDLKKQNGEGCVDRLQPI